MAWTTVPFCNHKFLTTVLLLVLCSCQLSDQVSFYGASYIKLSAQDSSSSTNVYIRFKTHRSDALLLLAAGTTDYCLVLLQDGAIKVRINLGAGETELSSTRGLRLDDLAWHDVEVQRDEAEMSVIVDGIHVTHGYIPGSFYELNIQHGVLCGGGMEVSPGFNELFLGNLAFFRGCMDEVSFNDYDVLGTSENFEGRTTHLVTWDCSDEFDGTLLPSSTISFMDRSSFLALKQMPARNGASISFGLKTQTQTAVLVYHSALASKADFVAVELVNGVVRMLVNKGNGVVPVVSNVTVSDGYWHDVVASFGPDELDLTVDSVATNLRISQRGNRFIDLNGYLYIGGIEINKQSRALRQGLESVDQEGTESSMQGCMRDLKVNNKVMGLLDAEITQGLRAECVWDYPCLLSPCIDGGECYQESYDDFRCFCDAGELCIRHDYNLTYAVYTKSTLPVDMEILFLHPLQVPEGGGELITTDLIQVTLDYQRYGVRESGVRFHIVEPPKFGALEVEIWHQRTENVFTLADLSTDKIRYSHYGSDDHHDTITFEIEFVGHSHRLPPFLEHSHKFLFHINVIPVNDPPRLTIPQDRVLRLASKTKKLMTSEYLNASDTDSSPSQLVYTVVDFGHTNDLGFIENIKNPGKAIERFTQQEVNNELISYVHEGSEKNGRVALRISDGIESGDMTVLRIATFELFISLANNTGLTVIRGSSAIITPVNLTFITNAINQQLDISYDITRMPQYGTVQKLKSSGRWQVTSRFSQKQIDQGYIRYEHAGNSQPDKDYFRFVVSSSSSKQSTTYEFKISFITVNVRITGSQLLILKSVDEATITPRILSIHTEPDVSHDADIGFHLVSSPSHGNVIVRGFNGQMLAQRPFANDFAFKLGDINEGKVLFRLKFRMYRPINDSFQLMAVTPGGIKNNIEINVMHIPQPSDVKVTISPVKVTEGEKVTITSDNLLIVEPNVTSFIFNITSPPEHGHLVLVDHRRTKVEVQRPNVVTGGHIKSGRLEYVHDDSESTRDEFQFVAFAGEWSPSDTVVHGSLRIDVTMKNDNSPYRVADTPFYVVKSGSRTITSRDILYSDKDIDTTAADIQYTTRAITNGKIVRSDNSDIQVYQFTQADIDSGQMLFKHEGELAGRTVLWVTDGQFYMTGILQINASDPFLEITTNVAPIVQHGDSIIIGSEYLAVTTNIDIDVNDIKFLIITPPKYGQVTRRGIGVLEFSQGDLLKGWVEYESDTALEFVDSFHFKVNAGTDISAEGDFEIKIYPESYWKPFVVVKNKTLNVSEGKWKWIDQSILKIKHQNVDPSDITFTVVQPPENGALFIRNFKNVMTFSQAMIDDRTLKYEQDVRNVTSDVIVFNVTNGVITLTNISLLINIIPSRVDLMPGLMTVLEGDSLAIEFDQLKLNNRYYSNRVRDYLITTNPRYGRIQNKRKPKKRITRFSPSQVRRGLIYYIHDGSETQKDRFSIVAVVMAENGVIRSSPGHVDVIVLPVDDQAPELVNNTGLDMWAGLSVPLGNDMLAAIDVDSQKSDINFRIVKSSDVGYFALESSPEQFLTSLPQTQIDSGLIHFFHTGGNEGTYVFELTDKVNVQNQHVAFQINAKPIDLSVQNLKSLQVFPRMQAIVGSDHLKVSASGSVPGDGILYEVKKTPTYGKFLIKQADSFDHVTEFSQEDVDNNMILYQSIGNQYVNDTVVFQVSNEYSRKSITVKLIIEISAKISKENLLGIIKPVEVAEGGQAIISEVNINVTALLRLVSSVGEDHSTADAALVIVKEPRHGSIICSDNKSKPCKVTAKDLADGKLVYQHDHSDTFVDSIDFNVVGMVNVTLDINLIPINDNNFRLLTIAPKIDVVFGMRTKLTRQHLYTEDPDGMLDTVTYEVISDSNNGHIELTDDGRTMTVRKFSQKDIDDGKVSFVHDGRTSSKGIFNIKVWDGSPAHKSVFKGCAVNILPLTLSIVNRTAIGLTQGTTVVALSSDHVAVETNGNDSNTMYKIDVQPSFGQITVQNEKVDQFSQQELDKQLVMYSQTDLSGYQDNVTLTIVNMIAELPNQVFQFIVKPLVKQTPVPIGSAQKTFITLSYLDASELGRQTDSNPMYNVVVRPSHGIIQRARERPYRSMESLGSFTHSDIKNNFIYYKQTSEASHDRKTDEIVFLLSALNVQPALGKLEIKLNPNNNAFVVSNSKNNISTTSEDVVVADSDVEVNYVLVVAVVVGLLVFFIVVICIIVRCLRKSKSTIKKNSNGKNGVIGVSDNLPPPPITPPAGKLKRKQFSSGTPPIIGMYSDEDDFAEIGAAVPMCKVTPLTDNHISSDCHKLQYDDPDSLYSDDLSSNGGNDLQWPRSGHQETQFSPPSNPLLRKNQYWV